MYRLVLSAVAGVLTLALSNPAQAGHNGGRSSSMSSHSMSNGSTYHSTSHNYSTSNSYHMQYGKKFSHGYYFSGSNHPSWSSSCWSSRYGCNCYWYPGTSCWYYWCAPQCCYYPVSYIAIAPPCASCVPVGAAPGGPISPGGPQSPAGPLVP